MATATCLGYPRMGAHRELKKVLEAFWANKTSALEVAKVAAHIRQSHWQSMAQAQLNSVPCNDFSLYDPMLDMAVCVGAVPQRYQQIPEALNRYFAMARGLQNTAQGIDLPALEMTKWFDTNYHYIVPEVAPGQLFALNAEKLTHEVQEVLALGLVPRPVILGPVTFLQLAKGPANALGRDEPLSQLETLLPVYRQLLTLLHGMGVAWVQLDEPCLVGDLHPLARTAYQHALVDIAGSAPRPKVMLTTYFGALGDNLPLALASGVEGLHLDLVRAPEQLAPALAELPATMHLSLGVVDGRNVWRTNLHHAHGLVRQAVAALGTARVQVAPSCSLVHCPLDLQQERSLDAELRSWLAFAVQKLHEVQQLAAAADEASPRSAAFQDSRDTAAARAASPRTANPAVRQRLAALRPEMSCRRGAYPERAHVQRQRTALPLFPTTTIGSFPQTSDIRAARASWRAGGMSAADYEAFLRAATQSCIAEQEALGLDVLVHGEFERTDMVEYFGQQLEGFAFTEHGWVQSYGSRCVKPPLLFGDVSRPAPMTVAWSQYAQSLTRLPVKAMLTGPVTILQWSFVRDDQPRRTSCQQIALALRDEVSDLEAAGMHMVQVDEPALREGLPLRRQAWPDYLAWAVEAFRLATCGVRDDTQIHTHMCYSEFGDILDAIVRLDADVLSIETSRSQMELLEDFAVHDYPNEVGPGVYDIHSARVPSREEIVELLHKASRVLPPARLWVNPDCGLKTRAWPEVRAALEHMVQAAKRCRADHEDC